MTNDKSKNIQIILENPIIVAQMLGHRDFTSVHNAWLKKIVYMQDGYWHLQGYRGSFKTTTICIGIIIRLMVYPEETIGVVRKKQSHADDIVRYIKSKMESKEFKSLCKMVGLEDPETKWWSNREFKTSWKKSSSPEPSLRSLSLFQNNTGTHYDWLYPDDMVTVKDRYFYNEREKTKRFLPDLINIKTKGIVYSSTPYHPDDASFQKMPASDKFPFGTIPFPQHIIDETLSKRKHMNKSEWAINYELHYLSDAEGRFVPDLKTIEYIDTEKYSCIMVIDPAYQGKDATAVTIGYKSPSTGELFFTGKLYKDSIISCYDKIANMAARKKISTIHIESNRELGTGDILVPDIAKIQGFKPIQQKRQYTSVHGLLKAFETLKQGNPNIKIPEIKTFHSSGQKHYRISTALCDKWDMLHISTGDDMDNDYLNQLMLYEENCEIDDAIDSLASFVMILTANKKPKSLSRFVL